MGERKGGQTVRLTIDPRLDAAMNDGVSAWEAAAVTSGPAKVAGWLAQRAEDPTLRVELQEPVEALLRVADPDEKAMVRAELAEFLQGIDDAMADLLWEGVLTYGRETNDPDPLFDATTNLAQIAEEHGEPLVAAEYYIEFLNWRRQAERTSDTEQVESAMEEIARLAGLDGETQIAAEWEFRQVRFADLVDDDDDRTTVGDWESSPEPYGSWS